MNIAVQSEEISAKQNLLDYARTDLADFFRENKEQVFRATQVMKWVHQQGVDDFSEMTNLSKSLRTFLSSSAKIEAPQCVNEQLSSDGTIKWLFALSGGNCIETVFIPEATRGTLCISSQVGCALNCSFCSTARQGFNRNLSVAEIIGQLWAAQRLLKPHGQQVTNVVMMGMGEPLLNLEAVVKAMDIMLDDFGYGLSKRRVTLSTSGLVPEMRRLSELSDVSLAVSLHAPTDELRNTLVPINKKYPLKQLMAACKDFFKNEPRRRVTFEYVMLDGVNDSAQQARTLVKLLEGVPSKVNLIPFNPFPGAPYQRSSKERIHCFRDILLAAGINTIVRKTRGEDIDAACGQLAGRVQDLTQRSRRYREQLQGQVGDLKNEME